jgi:hypothetical protein
MRYGKLKPHMLSSTRGAYGAVKQANITMGDIPKQHYLEPHDTWFYR